jgi:hypothetical protein
MPLVHQTNPSVYAETESLILAKHVMMLITTTETDVLPVVPWTPQKVAMTIKAFPQAVHPIAFGWVNHHPS